jgi:predicted metal-dependent phosphotriesterase family hydrolase
MTPPAYVMTVTGPVPATDLGVTLPHEHLLIDLTRQIIIGGRLNDLKLLKQELNAFTEIGGRTLVDCTTDPIGRDPLGLRELSEATGVNIIMGSGLYREPYISREWIDAHDADELAEQLVGEIDHGVGSTGIRPGVIGEIGSERTITALEERVLRAVARAQRQTGLTITTHTARWPNGLKQLAIMQAEGVDPHRVIIGHCDTVPSMDYHAAIAKQGAYVQFDTIRGDNAYDTERRVEYVLSLVRQGHLQQILLSHDVCIRSHLRASGGTGYTYVPTGFADELRKRGLTDDDIHQLLVENPRRALTGQAN